MLMMDRIVEISTDGGEFGKGHVVGELDIRPDLWFFGCYFAGDLVMPGSLGLDAMWQVMLLARLVGLAGQGTRGRRRRGRIAGWRHAGYGARAVRGQHAPGQAGVNWRLRLRTAVSLPTTFAFFSRKI